MGARARNGVLRVMGNARCERERSRCAKQRSAVIRLEVASRLMRVLLHGISASGFTLSGEDLSRERADKEARILSSFGVSPDYRRLSEQRIEQKKRVSPRERERERERGRGFSSDIRRALGERSPIKPDLSALSTTNHRPSDSFDIVDKRQASTTASRSSGRSETEKRSAASRDPA